MTTDTAKVRTVAIAGHGSSGKTSLIDTALFVSGTVGTHHRVDQGNSLADCSPDEIERKITIHSKPLVCEWNQHQIYLFDTPGVADFVGDAVAAIHAADAAVVVVDGVSGVEVGTRRAWKLLDELETPRLIFVNKLDKENSDFFKCVDQIRAAFGKNCIPFELPVGKQAEFSKVVNLRTTAADDVPDEIKDQFNQAHDSLEEAAAEQDDALIEKYLEGERLTVEQITEGTHEGIKKGAIVPIFCGSAEKEIGMRQLLDAVVALLPSPTERLALPVEGEAQPDLTADAPFCGFVFKVTVDPYAGALAYVRVVSGRLTPNSEVINPRSGNKEKITQLLRVQGKKQDPVDAAGPGDIVAVPKLKDTHINDTLCSAGQSVRFAAIHFPTPVMSLAIHPQSAKDEEKISTALQRLAEEDRTFRATRNANTRELVISGMGDIHLAVAIENMKSRFSVNVDQSIPKVDYRETVTSRAEGHHRHKKQSGGRGQFGEAYLRIEPRERSTGFEFVSEIVGGAIPKNFIPAVEKGCHEALVAGTVAGFPVEDVRAVVYDGSYHDVDSDELSFKLAGSHAFRDAMAKARPVLLEPIMSITVQVPDQFMGDITGDLSHRRGRVMGVEPQDGMQSIQAQVPQAEIAKYASELRSMTGGRGSCEMEFSHYDQVPSNVAQKVIAEVQAAKENA